MLVFLMAVSIIFLIASILYWAGEVPGIQDDHIGKKLFLLFLLFGFLAGIKYEDEQANQVKAQVVR